jgi:hypothetical protein
MYMQTAWPPAVQTEQFKAEVVCALRTSSLWQAWFCRLDAHCSAQNCVRSTPSGARGHVSGCAASFVARARFSFTCSVASIACLQGPCSPSAVLYVYITEVSWLPKCLAFLLGVMAIPAFYVLLYAADAALACPDAASGCSLLRMRSAQQRRSLDVCIPSAKLYRDIRDLPALLQTVL